MCYKASSGSSFLLMFWSSQSAACTERCAQPREKHEDSLHPTSLPRERPGGKLKEALGHGQAIPIHVPAGICKLRHCPKNILSPTPARPRFELSWHLP